MVGITSINSSSSEQNFFSQNKKKNSQKLARYSQIVSTQKPFISDGPKLERKNSLPLLTSIVKDQIEQFNDSTEKKDSKLKKIIGNVFPKKKSAFLPSLPVKSIEKQSEKLSEITQRLAKHFSNNISLFENEGIFRLSGGQGEIKKAYQQLIKNPSTAALPELPHDLAGLFKLVIRELNVFGATKELENQFNQTVAHLKDENMEEIIIRELQNLVDSLSVERQTDLEVFLRVLLLASEQQALNKMPIENLAIVIGPNLCINLDKRDPLLQLSQADNANKIASHLLHYYFDLKFKISPSRYS